MQLEDLRQREDRRVRHVGDAAHPEGLGGAGVDAAEVEDVLMGCANPEGATGANIARQIALMAGNAVATFALARQLGAERFVIITTVAQVALGYKKPEQRWLDRMSLAEAKRRAAAGEAK